MNLRPRKRGGVNASGWLSGRSWPLLRHGEQSAQMHKNFRMALSPLPDTTEMPTTIPADVNPPALSHNYAPVSRPEVASTTVESTPKPVLRRSLSEIAPSPLPDTTEMPTTIPGDVNPPALSHDNAPVSRPEVAQTAAGSPPKPVLRRSERQRRPPKHLSGFVLTKP